MSELVEAEGLELVRWGTRFARAETEAAYQDWYVRASVPLMRAGGVASLLAWAVILIPVYLAAPDRFLFERHGHRRDLKPANVLLAEGIAKINDFGISRFGPLGESSTVNANAATMAVNGDGRSSELTGTGVVMGTPLYMAPEAAGSARALDASADVFALGIIAYEMLTGRPPFTPPALVLAMAQQPIPAPTPIDDPRVPAALRALVTDCLAGAPGERPRGRAVLGAVQG